MAEQNIANFGLFQIKEELDHLCDSPEASALTRHLCCEYCSDSARWTPDQLEDDEEYDAAWAEYTRGRVNAGLW